MARKKSIIRKISGKAGKGKRAQGSRNPKNPVAQAAAIIILGGALMGADQCKAGDYELSFIQVQKKASPRAGEHLYAESSRAAMELAFSRSTTTPPIHPQFQKTSLSVSMLDIDRHGLCVAITDCGQCLCAACSSSVSTTVSASTTTAVASTTTNLTTATTTMSTATTSIACDCDCDCDGCCPICHLGCLC